MCKIFLPLVVFVGEHGISAAHSVNSGGHYSARISSALAAGVKPADIRLIYLIAQNAHGRRRAGLGRVNTASGMAKPLSILSIFKSASAYVSVTFFGSIFLRSLITTPVGSSDEPHRGGSRVCPQGNRRQAAPGRCNRCRPQETPRVRFFSAYPFLREDGRCRNSPARYRRAARC